MKWKLWCNYHLLWREKKNLTKTFFYSSFAFQSLEKNRLPQILKQILLPVSRPILGYETETIMVRDQNREQYEWAETKTETTKIGLKTEIGLKTYSPERYIILLPLRWRRHFIVSNQHKGMRLPLQRPGVLTIVMSVSKGHVPIW